MYVDGLESARLRMSESRTTELLLIPPQSGRRGFSDVLDDDLGEAGEIVCEYRNESGRSDAEVQRSQRR